MVCWFLQLLNRLESGKWASIGASRLRDVHSAHLQLLAMLVMGVQVGFVSLKRPGSGCALGLEWGTWAIFTAFRGSSVLKCRHISGETRTTAADHSWVSCQKGIWSFESVCHWDPLEKTCFGVFQSLLAFPGAGLVIGFIACQDLMAANLALSLATDETSTAVLQKEKSQSISMRLMRLQVGLTMQKTCKCFHSQASCGGSIRFYATEVLFFVHQIWAPKGTAMLVCSLPVKSIVRFSLRLHIPTLFMVTLHAQNASHNSCTGGCFLDFWISFFF